MNLNWIRLSFLLRLNPNQMREAIRTLLNSPAAQQLSKRMRDALLAILHEEVVGRLRELLRRLSESDNLDRRS